MENNSHKLLSLILFSRMCRTALNVRANHLIEFYKLHTQLITLKSMNGNVNEINTKAIKMV